MLARTGFNRKSALATATMTLAAEAPDLDVFASFKGPVFGFAHHRGFTHSFIGLLLTSAVVVAFMYGVWVLRGRKTNIPNLPPHWGLLLLFAYIAGLSHILLDFTNNYGVRPFWPFWEKWYEWGTAFILEPPMLALFVAGLVLPEFFSRSKPKPRGRTTAILALGCVIALWVGRAFTANKIEHVLRQQTFNSERPLRVSAYPYWSPAQRWLIELRWSAVIETRSSYVSARVNPSTGALDSVVELTKPVETPAIVAAKRSYVGRVYLDWARYPLVTENYDGALSKVRFWDLRFGYPDTPRTLLGASVTLDRNLRVVEEAMGPRPQTPLLD